MPRISETTADWIKRLGAQGWPQRRIAATVGVARGTVDGILSGRWTMFVVKGTGEPTSKFHRLHKARRCSEGHLCIDWPCRQCAMASERKQGTKP